MANSMGGSDFFRSQERPEQEGVPFFRQRENAMLDISPLAAILLRSLGFRRTRAPTPGNRTALAAISRSVGEAFKMCYVDPYTSHRPRIVKDNDPEDRDPSW